MKKISQHLILAGILAVILGFSGCSKNHVGQSSVKFGAATAAYNEDAGHVNIPVLLSATQGQDVSITYTFGTAGPTFLNGDFKILTPSPIVVKAGELTTNIEIEIINDTQLDSIDFVAFVLTGVSSNAKLTEMTPDLHFELTINSDDVAQADRLQVDLTWSVGPGADINLADLDLSIQDSVVINGGVIEDTGFTFTSSANTAGFETVYLNAADPDQDYYVAVPYVNGTVAVTYFLNLSGFGWAPQFGGSNATGTYTTADASSHTATFYGPFTKSGSTFVFNGRTMPTTPEGLLHFKVRDFITK